MRPRFRNGIGQWGEDESVESNTSILQSTRKYACCWRVYVNYINKYMIYTHLYIYILIYIYIERERVDVYEYEYVYIYIYIHTYIHTHIYIYIYIYTYTCISFGIRSSSGLGYPKA